MDAELKRGANVDDAASASVSVSADIPGTPVGLTARPGDGSITLSWNPPADDGGNPITEYRIRYKRDGATTAQNPYVRVRKLLGPSVRSHALTGLTNAQGYTVHVWAVSANGEGIENRAEITGATPVATKAPQTLNPPSRVITNGHSPDNDDGTINPKLKVAWTAVVGAAAYKLEYRKECYRPVLAGKLMGTSPHPCWPEQAFEWTFVGPGTLRVTDTDATTYEHEIAGLDLDRAYRVRVKAVNGSVESEWSEPAIGYVSNKRPENVFTFPIYLNWNPPADGSPPVYEYVLCNPIAGPGEPETPATDSTDLMTISSERAREIREGIARWQELTRWKGFWKNGSDYLIKVREINAKCGIGNDRVKNNPAVSEVKVLDEEAIKKPCMGTPSGCTEAPEFAREYDNNRIVPHPISVSSADIYLKSTLTTAASEKLAKCSGTSFAIIHEAGHALAIYGERKEGSQHHSYVKPSIMDASWVFRPLDICDPTYYDIAAIVAAYQGRFTIENE